MNCVYYHMWQNNVDKMVYHYTSFESAKNILETKSLRFGRLNGMNDINESYRAIWYPHEAEDVDKYENAVYSYRQISLTVDKPTKRGFDIPPMWGHYAQKGAGVCIVLDKDVIKKAAEDMCCKCGEVDYVIDYDSTTVIPNDNPDEFVEKNYKEIFYGKSKDWGYEQEWRIIKKCADASKEEYLDIESAIIAVILCNGDATDKSQTAFSTPVYESIKGLIRNQYPIFAYESFGGKSLLKSKDGCQIWPTCPFSTGEYELDV